MNRPIPLNTAIYRKLAVLLLCVSMVSACAHNPFKVAETPEEQTWVVLKSYQEILKNQVLPAMLDQDVPVPVRRTLGDINRRGTPAVIAFAKAIGEYAEAKAELATGESESERFMIALNNLSAHVQDIQGIIRDYKDALKEAGR